MQQRTFYVGVTAQMIICTSYWSSAHPGSVSQRFLSTKIFLVRVMFILKDLNVQEKWEKIFRSLLICVSALFWLVTKDQTTRIFNIKSWLSSADEIVVASQNRLKKTRTQNLGLEAWIFWNSDDRNITQYTVDTQWWHLQCSFRMKLWTLDIIEIWRRLWK